MGNWLPVALITNPWIAELILQILLIFFKFGSFFSFLQITHCSNRFYTCKADAKGTNDILGIKKRQNMPLFQALSDRWKFFDKEKTVCQQTSHTTKHYEWVNMFIDWTSKAFRMALETVTFVKRNIERYR